MAAPKLTRSRTPGPLDAFPSNTVVSRPRVPKTAPAPDYVRPKKGMKKAHEPSPLERLVKFARGDYTKGS